MVIIAQPCEYTRKTTESYTLKRYILCFVDPSNKAIQDVEFYAVFESRFLSRLLNGEMLPLMDHPFSQQSI